MALAGGFDPLRLLVLVGVLDDDAEAGVADVVGGLAEDPDCRDCSSRRRRRALAGAEEEARRRAGVGTGLPSRAKTWNLWPPKRAAVFDRAGVEEVEEDALALADADGFAGAEGLVVDGVGGRR